jgi:hypothetical protein
MSQNPYLGTVFLQDGDLFDDSAVREATPIV